VRDIAIYEQLCNVNLAADIAVLNYVANVIAS